MKFTEEIIRRFVENHKELNIFNILNMLTRKKTIILPKIKVAFNSLMKTLDYLIMNSHLVIRFSLMIILIYFYLFGKNQIMEFLKIWVGIFFLGVIIRFYTRTFYY